MTEQQQQDVLKRVSDSPVLSVGEVPRFTEWGGVVNFYISGGTVRFEINVPEARRRGLSIDAKLLSVAKLVGQ